MAWYGQKNYYDKMGGGNGGKPAVATIAQIGCFLTSFCNLEQRFGKDIDPPSLNRLFTQRGIYIDLEDGVKDELGWSSVTAYDGQVHASQINSNAEGTWPASPNSIVKFAYNSPRTGQFTTHFCLVADPQAHTIIDSWDGVIRTPGYYGSPVAYATYDNIVPQAVIVNTPPAQQVSQATDGSTYTFQKYDTVWAVAHHFGFTAAELIEHNGITDVRNIPVGYVMHLPVKQTQAPPAIGYSIEILPAAKTFHVSKAGGAEKWGFGNIKQWSDFVSNGHVAENTNLTITAVAKVQVGKEVAAYYMEPLAVGDYQTSGHITNTIGFNWQDVTEGPAPEQAASKAPDPIHVPKPQPEPVATPTPLAPSPAVVPDETSPNAYKATYKAFAKPTLFIALNTQMCKEYDGRRNDHQLIKNQAVLVAGTFIHGQQLLGRPQGAVKHGYWYGVPMDNLISEEELYSTKVDLPTKLIMHSATSVGEKLVIVLRFVLNIGTRLQTLINREK